MVPFRQKRVYIILCVTAYFRPALHWGDLYRERGGAPTNNITSSEQDPLQFLVGTCIHTFADIANISQFISSEVYS